MNALHAQPNVQPALAPGDSAAYLSRLGAPAPAEPTLDALAELHRAHLARVPFENLDIALGRPIRIDPDSLVEKVLRAGRGGYCYELNGLFALLLRSVGYAAELLSARVTTAGGGLTEDFDHLALLVTSPLVSHPQLVDVGFGDAFTEPLPLEDGFSRQEAGKSVGLARADDGSWAYCEDHGSGWESQYLFTTTPRRMADFEERNRWQQSSPRSHFTQKRVASRLTETGRVTLTLSGGRARILETTRGATPERSERPVGAAEVGTVLDDVFGIRLTEAEIRRLAAA
ncbi:arylamine N-acetyltransferase [Intrasporangium sp. DVR]|uniref:arylamine N-acetyltransferase family protein n=1 Tax=Intrasporangium sp. DVR TaxID=3127867 RepID=UPI00313A747F